ncbi:MAG: GNAT family N-acetyltransferase [Candidatus Nitrotoga sp.]|nr:GNAT family N-acetyltransferase [Candidatus Nitrotoga sp.]MDP1856116.1 GNAT family N-acetyltransferase [Candidatus Nitrotoga sp.]
MSLQLNAPQPLATTHILDQFECGEDVLDEWLKRRAMVNQVSGASRTFLRLLCHGCGGCLAPDGNQLLQDAINRAVVVSQNVGVRALLVHVLHDRAKAFYEHYGFQLSPLQSMTLMLRLNIGKS